MDYDIELQTLDPKPALAIRQVVPVSRIAAAIDSWLPIVFTFAGEHGAELAGPPYSRYHHFGEHETDLEIGLPVTGAHQGGGRVQAVELPGGEAAVTWHVGPYDQLADAYAALTGWIADQGRSQAGAPWEVYWTNPADEPDPATWRTQVFAPIR
jgi:effector-binding domain-containing protein